MARRTKEDALATRSALLDAAERLFESRGVARTSLHDIACEAGVTRGAVYWHFRDKADLFNAMMERAILPFEQSLPQDGQGGAVEQLRGLVHAVLRRTAVDAHVQRVFTIATQKVEYAGELDGVRERRLRVRAQVVDRYATLFARAAARQQLAPGVAPPDAALALHALVSGLIDNWMLDRDAFDLLRAGLPAVDGLLAGLTRPG